MQNQRSTSPCHHRCSAQALAMSTEAIEYVKKPAMEFIRDSWRLVKRCTKPDRNGELSQPGELAAALCAPPRAAPAWACADVCQLCRRPPLLPPPPPPPPRAAAPASPR